jgi:hypothetical protein
VGVSLPISKDLGGVRWGVFEVSGSVFWRRVHFLRASPRRLSYRPAALGPAIIAGIMACESAVPFRATRATSKCGNQLNSAHVLDTKCFYSSCATLPFRAILPSATAHGTFHVSATSSTQRT